MLEPGEYLRYDFYITDPAPHSGLAVADPDTQVCEPDDTDLTDCEPYSLLYTARVPPLGGEADGATSCYYDETPVHPRGPNIGREWTGNTGFALNDCFGEIPTFVVIAKAINDTGPTERELARNFICNTFADSVNWKAWRDCQLETCCPIPDDEFPSSVMVEGDALADPVVLGLGSDCDICGWTNRPDGYECGTGTVYVDLCYFETTNKWSLVFEYDDGMSTFQTSASSEGSSPYSDYEFPIIGQACLPDGTLTVPPV
jgi:hypothetical protein